MAKIKSKKFRKMRNRSGGSGGETLERSFGTTDLFKPLFNYNNVLAPKTMAAKAKSEAEGAKAKGAMAEGAMAEGAMAAETIKAQEEMEGSSLPNFEKGDQVSAMYDKGNNYYEGTIKKVNRDGTYEIKYTDGVIEKNVQRKYILTPSNDEWVGESLKNVPVNYMKNDYNIVMAAVQNNWRDLEYASDSLKNNREIVMEAVKQNGDALYHAYNAQGWALLAYHILR